MLGLVMAIALEANGFPWAAAASVICFTGTDLAGGTSFEFVLMTSAIGLEVELGADLDATRRALYCTADTAERGRGVRCGRQAERRRVGQVERVSAEFEVGLFGDANPLQQSHVDIDKARADEVALTRSAQLAGAGDSELGLVSIRIEEPLVALILLHLTEIPRAAGAIQRGLHYAVECVGSGVRGERAARIPGEDGGEFPATDDAIEERLALAERKFKGRVSLEGVAV